MDICETYGIVSCPCGRGPVEVTCTEVGDHKCHNFVITEDLNDTITEEKMETKEELIERLRGYKE